MKPADYSPSPAVLRNVREWLTYIVDFSGPNERHGYRDGVANGVAFHEDTHRDIADRLAWMSEALVPHGPSRDRAGPRYKGWDIRTYRALDLLRTRLDVLVGANPDDVMGTFAPGRTPEGQVIMSYSRESPPEPETMKRLMEIDEDCGGKGICFREKAAGVIQHDVHADLSHVKNELDLALRPFDQVKADAAPEPAHTPATSGDERDAGGPGARGVAMPAHAEENALAPFECSQNEVWKATTGRSTGSRPRYLEKLKREGILIFEEVNPNAAGESKPSDKIKTGGNRKPNTGSNHNYRVRWIDDNLHRDMRNKILETRHPGAAVTKRG